MQAPDDFDPAPGAADELAPGLQRVLAPNPSPMTYRGTNTYLLGNSDYSDTPTWIQPYRAHKPDLKMIYLTISIF